jgi:hypothetical protein
MAVQKRLAGEDVTAVDELHRARYLRGRGGSQVDRQGPDLDRSPNRRSGIWLMM